MIPSAPTAAAAARERLDQPPVARGVARVDDHRQVRVQLQPRHGAEVEREARRGLERPDPALAQDHVLVALLEHVVGGHQQLVERGRQPALEQHGLAELARHLEQRVVLHVARADLDHVGVLGDELGVRRVEQLGDDRQAGDRARLGEDLQPRRAQALERERRRARLERAAAQHAGARGRDRLRHPERLLARLDGAGAGDQRERARRADRVPVDREHRRLVMGQLGRRQLVRARDRDDAVDARHPLQAELADPLGVADGPDRGRQLAGQDEHVDARRLQLRAHGRDLGLARLGCHHDHHRPSSRTPSSSAPRWCASSWRTVRVTCARSSSGSSPKSRSSVSRKMTMRSGWSSRATPSPW